MTKVKRYHLKFAGMNYTTDDLDILGYRESVVLPKVRAVSK